MTSAKDTTGKPDYTLLPWGALLEVVRVREYGTRKYGDPENWRLVPRVEYVKALLRHVAKALSGEETDPESGLPHWAHVACNALFILETK